MTKNKKVDSDYEQKHNEVKRVGRRYLIRDLIILFFCGVFFSTAFPCFNWGGVAWFGIIPLYWMIRDKRMGIAALYGFCWGYGWSVFSFFWLREIEFFIPFGMAFVIACFPACWALMVPMLKRYLLIPVSVQLNGSIVEDHYLKPKLYKELL